MSTTKKKEKLPKLKRKWQFRDEIYLAYTRSEARGMIKKAFGMKVGIIIDRRDLQEVK